MPPSPSVVVVEPNRAPRRLMVVLHADMVGYSRLIGRDDAGTFLRLRLLRREVIDPALATHHGTLRNTAGDSLLVTFESIDHAVDAAIAIQDGIAGSEASHNELIQFRIGINIGDVIFDERDIYGDGINVAARLQTACPRGRICISRAVRDHARQRRDIRFEPLGPLALKNVEKSVDAFVIAKEAEVSSVRRFLRLVQAAIPTWRIRKAYAILAAVIPFVAALAGATLHFADLGASRSQREQVAALTASQKAIAEAIARDKGVPLTVITRILTRLEESAATPRPESSDDIIDLQKRLETKADEFVALRRQLTQLIGDDPRTVDLRAQADSALGKGDLATARDDLRHAAALELAATDALIDRAQARARTAGALLERSARIASVTLRYREAAEDYGKAAAVFVPFDRHEQWRLEMERAAMLRTQGEEFGDHDALLSAIEHYRLALPLVSEASEKFDWARNEAELGRALRALGEVEWGTDRLIQATTAFEAALTALARDVNPSAWADTQFSLGHTLWRLGEREGGTTRLQQSVAILKAVLSERNKADNPIKWAEANNSLGLALVAFGRREIGMEHLEEGLAAGLTAKEELDRHPRSQLWAQVLNNVGAALSSLGVRETGTARLEQAADAYREALTVRTRARVPLYWARTMDNLGLVLWRQGESEQGTARLEEAAATFRLALEERTASRAPRDRAMTQSNLGLTLLAIAERQAGTAGLTEAVTALQEASSSKSREFEPFEWAAAQQVLGNALANLGERESGITTLGRAVAAYDQALAERTRTGLALRWAETESLKGLALMRIGEREIGTARMEEAVTAQRSALEERPHDRFPRLWAISQNALGLTLMRLGERRHDPGLLHEAEAAYRAALAEQPGQASATRSAIENNLGIALRDIGLQENDGAMLEQAVAMHRAALVERRREQSPYLWSKIQCQLGLDLARLAERETGTSRFEEADAIFTACLPDLQVESTNLSVQDVERSRAFVQGELSRSRSFPP